MLAAARGVSVRSMRFEAFALGVSGLFAGACVTVAGLDNEYSLDPSLSLPSCPGETGTCVDEVPPGWVRVGYSPNLDAPCPSGFLQTDVQADPILGADICTCGSCEITTPPSCAGGQVTTFYDDGSGMCDLAGLLLDSSPPEECREFPAGSSGELSAHFKAIPPALSGGACSLKSALDSAKIPWVNGRVCVPRDESCEGDLCAGSGAFAECIMKPGPSECPEAFPEKHAIGDPSDIACGPCACSVQGSCTGTLELYTNGQCSNGVISLPANNTCVDVNSIQKYFTYKYFPKIEAAACSDEPPTPGVFTPKSVICCK